MKLKIISLMLAAFVFAGCNSSSNSSNGSPPPPNAGENDINELGYDPAQRWPDQGEFSYSHRYSYNGSVCETGKQTFGNRAEYCMGLQDQKRNKSCALPSRISNYKNQCGDDFQELNFKGEFYKSGFDSHIQERCSTDGSVSEFRNLKNYCDFLKDEALHKNCFWTDRNKHFRNKECKGDFSAMPSLVSGPNPPPVDNEPIINPPPPPPPPPEDPIQEIPVVKELKENGITTTVDWDTIRRFPSQPMPGDLPLEEKMKILWAELAANKSEIIKRKDLINSIEVTIYTDYRNYGSLKELAIDFETKRNEFKNYFPLFDKMQTYANELKIKFDYIHSGRTNDTVPYLPMRKMISAIEKNFADLKATYGLFAEIRVDSYSSYYSGSAKLTLNSDNLEADFSKFIKLLKPLGPSMNWFKANNVEVDADFDIENNSREVYSAFKVLETAIPSFDLMVKAGMVNSVSVYFTDGDQTLYNASKKLILSIGPTNQRQVSEALIKVGKMAQMQKDGNVKITVSSYELNENFNKSFGYLEKFWGKIKPKIPGKMNEIDLGYESIFYAASKKLILGYNSTEAQTEKVINEIK